MIKYILKLSLLLISITAIGQDVVSTQGSSYSNDNASIDFTIGEVVINTGTDGNNDLTQGFHQSAWELVGIEDYAPAYEVFLFPNPTEDVLNIKTSSFENVIYSLFDLHGKLILTGVLVSEQTSIQVGQLIPGAYSMDLVFENGNKNSLNRKSFKLVKKN